MTYDVAIIGGGINGLGTARDLAKRGLRVYLAEKGDFATGATGNSSGMIHGGLRYLLSDVQVTRDSCTDSGYIQKISQNLIFRIPFLMPVYRSHKNARAFLTLSEVFFESYDAFQPRKNGKKHGRLTAEEALTIEPGLAREGLLGAVTTDEWGVDSYRLAMLNALDARAHGAFLENYTTVRGLLRDGSGRVIGIDTSAGERHAPIVLNCTGAWNASGGFGAKVPVRPGKGIHLVFDARISDYALITFGIDGRQVFLMPHQNESWFGTTDDDFFGDPDSPEITRDEVEYLLRAGERIFPALRDYRCFATAVGLRPTLAEWGPNEDDLSREHRIIDHGAEGLSGFVSLIGGKLASYRAMSQDLADYTMAQLGRGEVACRTHVDALPGHNLRVSPMPLVNEFFIDPVAARRLVRRHGSKARDILRQGQKLPGGLSTACACEPTLECEVRHVLREEWVHSPIDLVRRCRVASGPCLGLRCAARVGQIYAEEKGGGAQDAADAAVTLVRHAAARAAPVMTPELALQLDRVEQGLLNGGVAL
jgi:glycerol-3-phosphate dehydrogenase